jgi:nitrate/nitrite-specific signal transduction histidine kinase
MGGIVYFYSGKTLTTAFVKSHLTIMNTRDFLLPLLIYSFLITITAISVLTIIVLLFISHRMAGPLYRTEKILNEMGEGVFPSLESIQFRGKDEMKSLAEAMKKMIAYLKEKMRLLDEIKHELTVYEQRLEVSLKGSKNEHKQELCRLKEKIPALQEKLSEIIGSLS